MQVTRAGNKFEKFYYIAKIKTFSTNKTGISEGFAAIRKRRE